MEEDIKYLEDVVVLARMLLPTSQKATIQEKEIEAIENLIKGYKDLEKENFNLKEKQIIDKCEVPTQDNFYDYYAQNYLQIPVSFLTKENLDWLEQHCEKAIRYATRNELKEHQITLELIERYKEMNKEIRDLKENKENYIPKSKLRELLKEIDDNNTDEGWWYINKIEELLQDKGDDK